MLVSLIMNLQNRGGGPTPPTDSGDGGFVNMGNKKEEEEMELKLRRMKQEEDDFVMILSQWVVNNN